MKQNQRYAIQEVTAMFKLFGVPALDIHNHLKRGDLAGLQEKVKPHWKRLVFQTHPDHGGNAEDFKKLANAYETIQSLKLVPSIPMRHNVIRVYATISSVGGIFSTTWV